MKTTELVNRLLAKDPKGDQEVYFQIELSHGKEKFTGLVKIRDVTTGKMFQSLTDLGGSTISVILQVPNDLVTDRIGQ